jgi:MerR family transcriptional regulator, light-induced transcriptional regulator
MEHYEKFLELLVAENKQSAVAYAMGLIDQGELDIVSLYEGVLAPSLRNGICQLENKKWCIWEEHMQTSIVRTIIECCYSHVTIERKEKYRLEGRGVVVLVCPSEEYHEIGLRMVADMFSLAGFEVAFIGANTPEEDIVSAVEYYKPKILGISASSSYALFTTGKVIKKVRREIPRNDLSIIVGGVAFDSNPEAWKEIGANAHVTTFKEIMALGER